MRNKIFSLYTICEIKKGVNQLKTIKASKNNGKSLFVKIFY